MSLRIRHLHLRVQTGEGLYGTRIAFDDGLVLLRADNTMGKSTCVQAIVYALGLERMLGPSSAIPLPHVMTTYLEDGQRELPVLESEVLLEIQNHKGESLTLKRVVVGGADVRLIRTWEGNLLTNPAGSFTQRDYFVRDGGSAQNEAGFLRKLVEFIGWDLPLVRRFNGSECPLYIEAICPLFIVEQKHGWAGIQANLPTYFGIREMAKRCVEFVLSLDAARFIEERQALEQEETALKNRWKNICSVAVSDLKAVSGRVVGLPEQPSAQWPLSVAPTIEVFRDAAWTSLEAAVAFDKGELMRLDLAPAQTAGEASAAARSQLEAAQTQLAQRELIAGELLEDLERERLQLASTESRLVALREDRRRNKDAQKLKDFGSDAGWQVVEHVCPTCQQHLSDSLLLQGPTENPMSLEENIAFIESQLRTFEHLRENGVLLIQRKEAELGAFRTEMEGFRAQIRSLRQTLLAATSTPAIEAVRLRLSVEARIASAERAIGEFGESMEYLGEVANAWREMLERRKRLPSDGFSVADRRKLADLEARFRDQLREFGFSSLSVDTLEISPDTYRPTREGFDLGFDLSASDNIRTIWAYLQGLLELSADHAMNHPGFLLFDEPRQQEAAEISFERLLLRAAKAKSRGQQIIFATSEPFSSIVRMTKGLEIKIVSFEGRVISRL